MKVSIITAVFNRADSIAQAISSVQQQTHPDVEHLVIDGASNDGTLDVLQIHARKLHGDNADGSAHVPPPSDEAARHVNTSRSFVLISEPDHGIYDALNKGLAHAKGEIIGLMHSDDFFADDAVLSDVAAAFSDPLVDAVYGDLEYVGKENTRRVIRRWQAGQFSRRRLAWGWMPPHPTLFVRRRVIEQWGGYDTQYRIAADYDAILRYFGRGNIRAVYIPRVLVSMRVGGESNRSLAKIWLKTREDYQVLRSNGVGGTGALIWKNLSKLGQFV